MSKRFYKFPHDLAVRKDLKASDKIVFAIILDHIGNNDKCWPGIRTLAKKAGLTTVTVVDCIKRLESAGLLNVDRRGNGKSSHYTISETAKETIPETVKETVSVAVKETIPVKKLNQLKSLHGGGKETYTEACKNLTPNQTDLNKTHSVGTTSFAFVLMSKCFWHLPQAKLDEYKKAYPGIDVENELRKAAQWLNDNPDRRKTANGMPRFLGGWLSRTKPPQPQQNQSDKPRPFTQAEEEAFLDKHTYEPTESEADELMKKVGLA
jgi:DNA-binding transcriptional regulator YhcF (GntR family)